MSCANHCVSHSTSETADRYALRRICKPNAVQPGAGVRSRHYNKPYLLRLQKIADGCPGSILSRQLRWLEPVSPRAEKAIARAELIVVELIENQDWQEAELGSDPFERRSDKVGSR